MFLDSSLSKRIKRKQLEAVIETDPIAIAFDRWDWISDGAGGLAKANPRTLPPQWGKLIGSSPAFQLPVRISVDGKTVKPDKVLVMGYKADVVEGDAWTHEGLLHEIVYVHSDRTVKTNCEVVIHG